MLNRYYGWYVQHRRPRRRRARAARPSSTPGSQRTSKPIIMTEYGADTYAGPARRRDHEPWTRGVPGRLPRHVPPRLRPRRRRRRRAGLELRRLRDRARASCASTATRRASSPASAGRRRPRTCCAGAGARARDRRRRRRAEAARAAVPRLRRRRRGEQPHVLDGRRCSCSSTTPTSPASPPRRRGRCSSSSGSGAASPTCSPGAWSTRPTTRWGRFRPYLLFGSVPLLALLVAIVLDPERARRHRHARLGLRLLRALLARLQLRQHPVRLAGGGDDAGARRAGEARRLRGSVSASADDPR